MMILNRQKVDILRTDTNRNLWLEVIQKTPHDIYHLPDFFELEAKRYQAFPEAILIQEDDKLFFAPYLLRNCHSIFPHDASKTEITKIFDVISPYGYSGILTNDAANQSPEFINSALDEMQHILKSKQVCSAFFRLHPLINQNLPELFQENLNIFKIHGQTISVDLSLSTEQIWNQTKADRRNKINKCKRLGLTSRLVNFTDYLGKFVEIYAETMERVGAKKTYFEFDYDYCMELKDKLGDSLHLCIVESGDEIASAGLYSEYQGIVQALFGGTRNDFFKLSPSSLETDYIRSWAKERGNKILHLGGGLGGIKDSLYEFKSSFSKQSHLFLTMQLIINPQKYNYLVEEKVKQFKIDSEKLINSNFFPAYRYSVTNKLS